MSRLAVALIFIIVIGVIIGLISSYQSANSLELHEVSLRSFNLGVTSVSIQFDLNFKNRSPFMLVLRDLDYKVYVADRLVGTGYKESLIVPAQGSSTVPIEVKLTVVGTISYIASLLMGKDISGELRVSGKLPIMLFGIIELPAYIPVSYSKTFSVAGHQPLKVSAEWLGTQISPGQCIQFLVTLAEQDHYVVEVREDRMLEQDRTVARYNGFGTLKETFCLNYTPPSSVRGFFLKVIASNGREWQQEANYPPRLKLSVVKTRVSANWESNSISVGECVFFSVSTDPPESFTVEVREDRVAALDVTIRSYHGHGSLRQQFCLTYSPDVSVRGYFIKLILSSGDVWEQDTGYPPRLSLRVPPKHGTPTIIDAVFMSGKQRIGRAKVGETIEAIVRIMARGGPLHGKLTVNIKKDIPLGTDVVYVSRTFDVNLADNQELQVNLVWSPDQASDSQLRGYFIEVLFDGEKVWTMPDSYPPRLRVEALKTGYVRVIDAFWVKDGVRVTSVNLGDRVEAHVVIQASGGDVEGTIRVKIRKDIAFAPDEDFDEKVFAIKLEEGQTLELVIEFRPNQRSGTLFRGLFIEVDMITWNQQWTMADSYPPRLRIY